MSDDNISPKRWYQNDVEQEFHENNECDNCGKKYPHDWVPPDSFTEDVKHCWALEMTPEHAAMTLSLLDRYQVDPDEDSNGDDGEEGDPSDSVPTGGGQKLDLSKISATEYNRLMDKRKGPSYKPHAARRSRSKHKGGRFHLCPGWWDVKDFIRDMGPQPPNTKATLKDPKGCISCGKCEECVREGRQMNCQWSPPKTNTKQLEINGVVKSLSEWCLQYHMPQRIVYMRMRIGFSAIAALTAPYRKHKKRTRTLNEAIVALPEPAHTES